jgi:hypothetical protein
VGNRSVTATSAPGGALGGTQTPLEAQAAMSGGTKTSHQTLDNLFRITINFILSHF